VKQQGVTLVVVLGPLIGPADLPGAVLRIVVVPPVQGSPSARAGADVTEEITEIVKLGTDYTSPLTLALEHVAVAVLFCLVAPAQFSRAECCAVDETLLLSGRDTQFLIMRDMLIGSYF
jgi:hypothetical protein